MLRKNIHTTLARLRRSRDVDLLDILHIKQQCRISWIPDLAFRRHDLLVQLHQPLPPINASVGQHDRIILDMALSVVRIGYVSRELVQLRAADGADGRAGGGGGRAGVARMARGSFERREAGGKSDVERRASGKREEVVMRANEKGGEVMPAIGGVHGLEYKCQFK